MSQKTQKSNKSSHLKSWNQWFCDKAVNFPSVHISCQLTFKFKRPPFRSCISINPQTPGDGQGRNEYRSFEFLSRLSRSMCVSLCAISRNYSTCTHMFWPFLQSCIDSLSPYLCVSVPWRNHQKHPGGGRNDNLWSLVLSAGCHRLGYEGSRDPHRISERGKNVMFYPSNSLNLINQSQAVRCKGCWKYVDCSVSSSFFALPFFLAQ